MIQPVAIEPPSKRESSRSSRKLLHFWRLGSRTAVALLVCATLLPVAVAARPNVILIMTDDMGYGDLGFHGNPVIKTPHLDAMARRSSIIKQFYVSPVCAPTRASLMTGRYNYRTRAIDTYVGRAMMDTDEYTVAEALGEAGYDTGIFGKWHLGDCYPLRPMDQGFRESLVHHGGGIGQPSDPPGGEGKYTDPILYHNGIEKQMKGYCTDVYYQAAFRFIETASKKGQPFFVYLPDNCPHGPFGDVPAKDYADYQNMKLGNDQFPQDQGHQLPPRANTDKRARIFAMITNVDRNVGRLFERLKALGVHENTIVIFMVDNGPNGRRYVAGMKGNKSMVHEGGVRSPLFVHWPTGLPVRRMIDGPFAHIDVMPTILEACGAGRLPEQGSLDGVSFLTHLQGREQAAPERPIVIQAHRGDVPVRYHNFMLRQGKWKLLNASGFGREELPGPPKFELYDLAVDPLEMQDLAGAHPEIVERLAKRYDRWFDDVGSTRPDNYAPPRIHVGTTHELLTRLTRQDWRHLQGRPWALNSLGHWLLTCEPGEYSLEVRFASSDAPETLTLTAGDVEVERAIEAGSRKAKFAGVPLPAGDISLQLELRDGKRVRGVHQVDMRKR